MILELDLLHRTGATRGLIISYIVHVITLPICLSSPEQQQATSINVMNEQDKDLIASLDERLRNTLSTTGGVDSEGRVYKTIHELWESELLGEENGSLKGKRWYSQAKDYWDDEGNCPSTVDGVLGGFASISEMDIVGSRNFLLGLSRRFPSLCLEGGSCCDCGAGIGRISKGLLLPLGFKRCDLVEVSQRLLFSAPEYIGDDLAGNRCRYLCVGLQDFCPKPSTYDLIWIQWVIGHLTDGDCVRFLERCRVSLKPGGMICIKDNTSATDTFVVDKNDSSLTRSLPYLLHLCEITGLNVVHQKVQNNFPTDIYPVHILALGSRTELKC